VGSPGGDLPSERLDLENRAKYFNHPLGHRPLSFHVLPLLRALVKDWKIEQLQTARY